MKKINQRGVVTTMVQGRHGNMARTTLVLLALVMFAGAGAYYYVWKQARVEAWKLGEDAKHYKTLHETFLDHVRAGKLDQGYALTSRRFQQEVSQERFAELARRYVELDQQSEDKYAGESVGQSGPPSGDPSGLDHQHMVFNRQFRYRDGKLITITIEIRRDPDSVLLQPPGFKVDVFSIEEKAAQAK